MDIFILIVIEIIIIILVVISINIYRNRHHINSKNIRDIVFCNCDLLSVCIPNINGRLVQLFTGSRITHLGMVVIIDGKTNVIEVGYYNNYRGSRIIPIDKWLDKYSDFDIFYLKLKDNNPKSEDILRIYNTITPCDIDLNVISWLKTLTKIKYNGLVIKDKYYCTEFIVIFLQELGIMKKIYKPYCYTPRSIMNLKREMEDKYMDFVNLNV